MIKLYIQRFISVFESVTARPNAKQIPFYFNHYPVFFFIKENSLTLLSNLCSQVHSECFSMFPDNFMSEITIVLLGWVSAVKSKVCCALLENPADMGRTKRCLTTSTVLANQLRLTVVDTPGWWKYFSASLVPSHTRTEIDRAFKVYQESASDASSGRAILLMIPADTSFTREQLKIIKDNMKPLGESIWQNTILVFTRGHWLGQFDIEHHIESEGEALVWLVEQCGNRYVPF